LDLRVTLANGGDQFEVATRLDLDLNALITRSQFAFDLFEQHCGRLLQADGNAARNFRLRAAEMLPQCASRHSRFEIPDGGFDTGFGHAVAAYASRRIIDLGGPLNPRRRQHWRDIPGDDEPGGVDC